jgi:hypothetical protein
VTFGDGWRPRGEGWEGGVDASGRGRCGWGMEGAGHGWEGWGWSLRARAGAEGAGEVWRALVTTGDGWKPRVEEVGRAGWTRAGAEGAGDGWEGWGGHGGHGWVRLARVRYGGRG